MLGTGIQASRYSVQQGNFLEVICRNHFQGLFCFFVRGDSSCVVNWFVLVTSDLLKVSKIDMMTSGSVFRSRENKHLTISQIYWIKNYYNCIHSLHTEFYVKKYKILANLIFCCSKILYFSDIYHLESQKLHKYFFLVFQIGICSFFAAAECPPFSLWSNTLTWCWFQCLHITAAHRAVNRHIKIKIHNHMLEKLEQSC